MSSAGQIVGGVVGGIIGFYMGGPAGAIKGAALGAGIGGYIDPPPGPNLRGPTLDDTSYQSTAYGVGIPKIWGTVAVSGNIIWLENDKYKATSRKKKQGGKGGGGGTTVTTTHYSATFAVALCEAVPGALVRRIWAGGKLIYSVASSDISSLQQSSKSNNWRFYDGTQTEPDSRMEAALGVGRCPSYEGTAYIVFRDFSLEDYGNGLQGCPIKVELVCNAVGNALVSDFFSYKVVAPADSGSGFGKPEIYAKKDFDFSDWDYSRGFFGGGHGSIVHTPVSPQIGKSIWLRKNIMVPPNFLGYLYIGVYHDDGAALWINGARYNLLPVSGYVSRVTIFPAVQFAGSYAAIALQVRDGVPTGSASGILAGIEFSTSDGSPVYEADAVNVTSASLRDVVATELADCGIEGADLSALEGDIVDGYRTVGLTSGRAAIAPLQAAYMFDLVERGYQLVAVKRGGEPVATIPYSDLLLADTLVEAEREQDSQLPSRYSVQYIDYNREYDTNEQYADYPSNFSNQRAEEFAVVMSADRAAQLADVLINLAWVERERFKFSLPQKYLFLQNAQTINCEVRPGYSRLLRISGLEKLANQTLVVNARAADSAVYNSNAAGSSVPPAPEVIPFIGDAEAFLIDAPMLLDAEQDVFGYTATMTGDGETWPGGVLMASADSGQTFEGVEAFYGKGTIARAVTVLGASDGLVIERDTQLVVSMIAGDLEAITEQQMMVGRHYCAYGVHGRWELLQYANAVLGGDGNITLSTFVRGVRGTEWATGLHQADDYFILLDDEDVAFVGTQPAALLVPREYKAVTVGDDATEVGAFSFNYGGANLRPLSPVRPVGEFVGEQWDVEFIGRTRYSDTFWVSGQQPQNEAVIEYRMDVISGGQVVRTLSSPVEGFTYTLEQQREDFNGFATASLQAEIYQVSQRVGRGYPVLLSASTGIDPLAPSPARVVAELPYYFWVSIYGQAATDIALNLAPTAGRLMLAAAAPSEYALQGEFIVDDASLGIRALSHVQLSAAVDRVVSAWAVAGNFSVPVIAQVGDELVQITALADGAATVTRGILDTIPQPHAAGAHVVLLSDLLVRDFINSAGDTAGAKVLPRSIFGELPDAPVDSMEFNSRAIRPLPPRNVKINGEYWPDEVGGAITLSWEYSNRLQETGGALLGWYSAGTSAPEPGTTYTVNFYTEHGTVPVHTDSTTGNSVVWDPGVDGVYRVELLAAKGGHHSRPYTHVIQRGAGGWYLDTFDSGSLALYTIYNGGGADPAIVSGALEFTATSSQQIVVRTGETMADCEVMGIFNRAHDGGLAFRVMSATQYYVATIHDASDSEGGSRNTVALYRRSGSTFTQIGARQSIPNFIRGTDHELKVSAVGSALQVYFDGVLKISVTDATYASGLAGPRGNRNPVTVKEYAWRYL